MLLSQATLHTRSATRSNTLEAVGVVRIGDSFLAGRNLAAQRRWQTEFEHIARHNRCNPNYTIVVLFWATDFQLITLKARRTRALASLVETMRVFAPLPTWEPT